METRIGESGELLVRGDYVMLGYLDDPEATREAIDGDGWLHTGDVGSLDADRNLKITDRLKDMYISGGFNVYPAEVEQALARLDGVADVAVVGVPDERMGEVGRAYVVRAEDSSLTEDDVLAFARERLANFKVPRQVAFADALPRNLSGKVLKTQLREG
jgi:acyl-CoA synthetase (AMP-forming)/AMP-acid ligase II